MEKYHSPLEVVQIQEDILKWFASSKREMPWRTNVTAYGTLVSEIMLQQTQVATVIPYFNKWMEKFPSIEDLANADADDVLKLWKGLGYYSRATRLISAAKIIVEKHDGKIPNQKADLLKIPGIGPYTCGAILSIAFGQKEALVDGNVIRVLSRLFAILKRTEEKIHMFDCKTVNDFIWKIAAQLVPEKDPGYFNESLMELGSEICTPKSPKCSKCPIQSHCMTRNYIKKRDANKANAFFKRQEKGALSIHGDNTNCELCDIEDLNILTIEDIPLPKIRADKKIKSNCVLYIKNDNGEVLIQKRKSKGLLAGLWEFPMIEYFTEVEAKTILQPYECEFEYITDLTHIFTHIRQTLSIYEISSTPAIEKKFQGVWLDPNLLYENSEYPLWQGMVKILLKCHKK
eukprot:NODE_6_length_70510_cov_1.054395.p21 type:complete len:402 gc:universal NODE_6_length_70510_cov_1.054395:1688-2893(+)